DFDAAVGGSDPESGCTSAGYAGNADSLRIDVLARQNVIDRTDAVPAFDSRRSVASTVPPPARAEIAVGSVMKTGYFSELKCIENQTDVPVAREPQAVILEGGLVAVAAAAGMSANIENGWTLLVGCCRTVKVGSNIESGLRLKVNHFNNHAMALQSAGKRG